MLHGTAREMGLGGFRKVSLADARQKAAEAQRLLADGVDPLVGGAPGRGQVASGARGHIRQRCCRLSSSPSRKLEKRQAFPAVAQYVSDFGLAGFWVAASIGDQHRACSESA